MSWHPGRVATLLICASLFFSSWGSAQSDPGIERPRLAAGDGWTFRRIDMWKRSEFERVHLQVTGGNDVSADLVQTTSPAAGAGSETKSRSFDLRTWSFAEEKRVGDRVDLAFPLFVGKKWTVEFKSREGGGNYLMPHTRMAHVEAWETVTVPAGTFRALRVAYVERVMLFIGDGIFPAYMDETVWYAPSVKWIVKREEVVRNPLKKIETQVLEELVQTTVPR